MGAIRQKLLFQRGQHLLRRTWILGERLGEEPGKDRRFYIRKDRSVLDVLKILSEQIHYSMPNFAKFACVHGSSGGRIWIKLLPCRLIVNRILANEESIGRASG
jgi:hypothetical protein